MEIFAAELELHSVVPIAELLELAHWACSRDLWEVGEHWLSLLVLVAICSLHHSLEPLVH